VSTYYNDNTYFCWSKSSQVYVGGVNNANMNGYTGNELVTGVDLEFTLDLRKMTIEMLVKGLNKKYTHQINNYNNQSK
jgi:hypothetical protein